MDRVFGVGRGLAEGKVRGLEVAAEGDRLGWGLGGVGSRGSLGRSKGSGVGFFGIIGAENKTGPVGLSLVGRIEIGAGAETC